MKYTLLVLSFLLTGFLNSSGQIITTIAGGVSGHGYYWGDGGLATDAAIGYTAGIGVDDSDNLYIGDTNNQRLRKVNARTGIITSIAGTGVAGYNGDGIPASSAQLNFPGYVSLDTFENIYIIDGNNFRVRKINAVTGIISTFAGTGVMGSSGDGGPATAATIGGGELVWDNFGNAYLRGERTIRKIAPSGIITTIAGTGLPGVTGEGIPALTTNISPRSLAVDVKGNVYFGDTTSAIRKITISTGIITRVAGTGDNVWGPYSGDGLAATTCHMDIYGISVDDSGNIYNSDYGNSRIEKIDTFGIIHTIAGTGISGFSGDGSIATLAKISFPENVVLDKCNNVYICDFNNRRVRKITYRASCDPSLETNVISPNQSPLVYPNPVTDVLHINTTNGIYQTLTITNSIGQVMLQQYITAAETAIPVSKLPAGIYYISLRGSAGVVVNKFIKD